MSRILTPFYPDRDTISAAVRRVLAICFPDLKKEKLLQVEVHPTDKRPIRWGEMIESTINNVISEYGIEPTEKCIQETSGYSPSSPSYSTEKSNEAESREKNFGDRTGEKFLSEVLSVPLGRALEELTPQEAMAVGATYCERLSPKMVTALLGMKDEKSALRAVHRAMAKLETAVLHHAGDYSEPPNEKTIALYDDIRYHRLAPQQQQFVEEILSESAEFTHGYRSHLRLIRLLED